MGVKGTQNVSAFWYRGALLFRARHPVFNEALACAPSLTFKARSARMTSRRQSARRQFLIVAATGAAAVPLCARAQAMVDPKDPQAVALGYVADAKNVDRKKFPKFAPGQLCSNCALYQGKATDPAAACAIFPGKKVAGPGWCSAWVKKA